MESNEQNKLSNDIETDAENRLTDVREEGIGDLVRRVKGLSKRKKKKTQGHRQQSGDCQQKRGWWGEVEEGKVGINGEGRTLDWVVNTQYNIQIMYCRIVYRKPI